MKTYFSIMNNQKIIDELKKQNFDYLKIDQYDVLSWISIEDKNCNVLFSKSIFEGKETYCLMIYEILNSSVDRIKIPLEDIEAIYIME